MFFPFGFFSRPCFKILLEVCQALLAMPVANIHTFHERIFRVFPVATI
jgi:hypothetical protein